MNLKLDNCKFYLYEELTDPHGRLLEVVVDLNVVDGGFNHPMGIKGSFLEKTAMGMVLPIMVRGNGFVMVFYFFIFYSLYCDDKAIFFPFFIIIFLVFFFDAQKFHFQNFNLKIIFQNSNFNLIFKNSNPQI